MPKTTGHAKARVRQRSSLSCHVEKALNGYTLAASAAVAAMCATPAQAKVQYTLVEIAGSCCSSVTIDLNHDGIVDFTLAGLNGQGIDSGHDALIAFQASQNGVAVQASHYFNHGQAFGFGQEIGPNLMFAHASHSVFLASEGTNFGLSVSGGSFMNAKNKFIGLQFILDGQTFYGWARIDVKKFNKYLLTYELVDYAYQDKPGVPILAGQGIRQGSSSALGILALGDAGLPLLRSRIAADDH